MEITQPSVLNGKKETRLSLAEEKRMQLISRLPLFNDRNKNFLEPFKTEIKSFEEKSASSFIVPPSLTYRMTLVLFKTYDKIPQEVFQEFCLFLGLMRKCLDLKKIRSLNDAQEEFIGIHKYIHDSVEYGEVHDFEYFSVMDEHLSNDEFLKNICDLTLRVIF